MDMEHSHEHTHKDGVIHTHPHEHKRSKRFSCMKLSAGVQHAHKHSEDMK